MHSSHRISNQSNSALALVRQVIPIWESQFQNGTHPLFHGNAVELLSKREGEGLVIPAYIRKSHIFRF
jgi:hypothetical protein